MNTQDRLLAAALASRGAADTIVLAGEEFDGVPGLIWAGIRRWYELDPKAQFVDAPVLADQLATGSAGPKAAKALRERVMELAGAGGSAINVAEAVRLGALERSGHKLAARLVAREPDPDALREALTEYQQVLEAQPGAAEAQDEDWRGLIRRRVDPAKKWRVTPKALNDALDGGVLPGHNLTIYARPEVGKTALALTMACGFARRGKRVLYVVNEESVDDLRVRALTNLLGQPKAELMDSPEEYEQAAIEKGASNLFFRELSPGTKPELERLVAAVKPQVLVVDQLRNLRSKSENFTRLLDEAAQFVRALGKRHRLVTIGLTQAAESARNKAVLDDGDIDSSNTGIPGAADVLIGVGVNDGLRAAGQRVVSLCKNKISARHEHFTVYLEEPLSRVRS